MRFTSMAGLVEWGRMALRSSAASPRKLITAFRQGRSKPTGDGPVRLSTRGWIAGAGWCAGVILSMGTTTALAQGAPQIDWMGGGHADWVFSCEFSPNNQWLATGGHFSDSTMKLWDVATGRLVRTIPGLFQTPRFFFGPFAPIAFSPDSASVAALGEGSNVAVWSVADGALRWHGTTGSRSLAWSPDGAWLALGALQNGTVRLLDASTGIQVRLFSSEAGPLHWVAFSPDSALLAGASANGKAYLWRVADGVRVQTLIGHVQDVYSTVFFTDGQTLATGGADGTIRFWNVTSGAALGTWTAHTGPVHSLRVTADGVALVSGSADNSARVWRIADGELLRSVTHPLHVASAVTPDGARLCTVGRDRMARLWNAATGAQLTTLTHHTAAVQGVAISPDAQIAASVAMEPNLRLWRMADGALLNVWNAHSFWIGAVAFSPDGQLLASGGGDRLVKIWNPANGALIRSLAGHTWPVYCLAFQPDGSHIASGSITDETIRLWRLSDGLQVQTFATRANALAFSADGQFLFSGYNSGDVSVWRVSDGTLARTLSGHTQAINALAVSASGELVASSADDGTARIWNIATGAPLRTLTHTGRVQSLAFSPDSRYLTTGESNRSLRIWRVADGAAVAMYDRETGSLGLTVAAGALTIAYSPDTRGILYGRDDATIVAARNPFAFAPGDTNCDGVVNFDDIESFVLALISPAAYQAAQPNCARLTADVSDDGVVSFDDIDGFVAAIVGA